MNPSLAQSLDPVEPPSCSPPTRKRCVCLGRWILIARPTEAYPFARPGSFVAVRSKSRGSSFVVLLASSPRALSLLRRGRGVGRSVQSPPRRRSTALWSALNAHRAAALGSPRFTCPRRLGAPLDPENPRSSSAVALLLLSYLSSGQPFLAFLCTPPSLSEHPQPGFELPSPHSPSPPLPHLGSLVKAVTRSSSFSV